MDLVFHGDAPRYNVSRRVPHTRDRLTLILPSNALCCRSRILFYDVADVRGDCPTWFAVGVARSRGPRRGGSIVATLWKHSEIHVHLNSVEG